MSDHTSYVPRVMDETAFDDHCRHTRCHHLHPQKNMVE